MAYKKERKPVSKEAFDIIARVMRRTYEYIGGDLLNAVMECEGRDYMTKAEVIECVIDADRMRDPLRSVPEEKAAVDFFYTLPWEQMVEIGKKVFPFARYS